MLSDSGRLSSGHFRWKEKNRFIFSPVSSQVDAFVLTKRFGFGRADTTLAGGGDVNGRLHTHSHSLTFTHSPTSPTSPTSPPTSPTSPTALTHSLTHSLHFTSLHSTHFTHSHIPHSHTHHTHITHSHSHSLTVHEHTYIHTNSPTITAPSLLYFLFPSCSSMVSLSRKKLVTCGVIRSFNFETSAAALCGTTGSSSWCRSILYMFIQ